MKIFLAILFIAIVSMVAGQGFPTKQCPPGEHSVLYCPRKAEPSCENPTIHNLQGPAACGIPDCWCNTGTVRDTATNKCVKLSDCKN